MKLHIRWLKDRIENAEGKNEIVRIYSLGSSLCYFGEFSELTIDEIKSRPEVSYVEIMKEYKKQW